MRIRNRKEMVLGFAVIVAIWGIVNFAVAFGAEGAENVAETAETMADPIPLKVTEPVDLLRNADAWYPYLKGREPGEDPAKVFVFEDGTLHVSGEEMGCVTTREAYRDYRLTLEFRWGDRTVAPRVENARDSGLLIHSVGRDGAFGGCWKYSIECNIIEGGLGDFIVVGDGSETYAVTADCTLEEVAGCRAWRANGGEPWTIYAGRINWFARDPQWKDVKDFRGKDDLDRAHGEWNQLEVVAKEDRIEIFVNGTLVNRAYNVKPTGGQIQLQSEGAEIFFRNMKVTPLP